jgi:DNA ligase (NAD+)
MTKSGKIPEQIKKEIEQLVKDLSYHCYRYYVLDAPVISDAEYDREYRRLRDLEEKYDYVLPGRPLCGWELLRWKNSKR